MKDSASTRPSEATRRATGWRLSAGVFLLALAGYLLTASGHLQGMDQHYYYSMARSLLLERSLAIEPMIVQGHEWGGRRGIDGRFYAQYPPGWPAALVPFVAAGRALAEPLAPLQPAYRWMRASAPEVAARLVSSYANGPITAATAALLTLLALRLGYGSGAAIFVGLAFAFATHAWPHARVLFAEPLQGLLLTAAFLLLLRASPRRAVLGGLALGLAVLVKTTSVLALPAFMLLPDSRDRPLWRMAAAWVLVSGPFFAMLGIQALYNVARFGNPLLVGYGSFSGLVSPIGDPLVGLFGLLLSSGRGIVWYAPPVLAALLGLPSLRRRHPAPTAALVALALLWIPVHAAWRAWDGGWGWGPRFLLPITPLLLLPLAACWGQPRLRAVALSLSALGVLVQFPAAVTDFYEVGHALGQRWLEIGGGDFNRWRVFDPAGSEMLMHWEFLLGGQLDLGWLTYQGTWAEPATLALGVLLLGAGLLSLAWPCVRLRSLPLYRRAGGQAGRPGQLAEPQPDPYDGDHRLREQQDTEYSDPLPRTR